MRKSLVDSWAKLDWAKRHFDELSKQFVARQESDGREPPFAITVQYEPPEKAVVVRVGKITPIPKEWSLIIGDALFNFRASLDYLAQVLVKRGTCPHAKRPHAVLFPYEKREGEWEDTVNKRLPGILKKHRTVVEKFQPYQIAKSGENIDFHPLALLGTLSNADKHHRITILYGRHRRYRIIPQIVEGFEIKSIQTPPINRMMPVKPGAELGRLIGKVTATNSHVKVEIEGATIVAFENGANVRATLDKIGKTVASLLSEIEPLF